MDGNFTAMHSKWKSPGFTVIGEEILETPEEKKIKAKVMDDEWIEGAAVSELLIPGTEISFLLVSLRVFHMRDLAPCCRHPQSWGRPSRQASDIWHRKWERIHREGKKRRAVHYFIYTVQRKSPSQQEKTSFLHGKAWRWLNVRKTVARQKKWKVEAGKIKGVTSSTEKIKYDL